MKVTTSLSHGSWMDGGMAGCKKCVSGLCTANKNISIHPSKLRKEYS